MKTGVKLIKRERKRQIALGYNDVHDYHENKGELAVAGALYALNNTYAMEVLQESTTESGLAELWPWTDIPMDKNKTRIRELVIAGALIAAEIDRLTLQIELEVMCSNTEIDT